MHPNDAGVSIHAVGRDCCTNAMHLITRATPTSGGLIKSAGGPGASEDVGVLRKEPQRSIGKPVDLLDAETGGLYCRAGIPVGVTTAAHPRPQRGNRVL